MVIIFIKTPTKTIKDTSEQIKWIRVFQTHMSVFRENGYFYS